MPGYQLINYCEWKLFAECGLQSGERLNTHCELLVGRAEVNTLHLQRPSSFQGVIHVSLKEKDEPAEKYASLRSRRILLFT